MTCITLVRFFSPPKASHKATPNLKVPRERRTEIGNEMKFGQTAVMIMDAQREVERANGILEKSDER